MVHDTGGEVSVTLNEIGERLRQRREELGLSLRDAQTATKIRWRYLEALEQGDDSVIPGYVYAKGFLRTYAEYLGLDGWELVEAYKLVREGPAAESSRPGRPGVARRGEVPPGRAGPGPRAAAVGATPLRLPPKRPPAGRSRGGTFFGVVLLLVMLAAAAIGVYYLYLVAQQPPEGGSEGDGPGVDPPAAEQPALTPPPEDPAEEPAGAEPDSPEPRITVERSGSSITYRLAADTLAIDVAVEARCWVRVEADGSLVAETTLQPGQQVTWQAEETLRVRVGYPAGLRLSVAGQPLELEASDAVTLIFIRDA